MIANPPNDTTLGSPDHLQQPHHWDWVEEVKTTTPIQARYILHHILTVSLDGKIEVPSCNQRHAGRRCWWQIELSLDKPGSQAKHCSIAQKVASIFSFSHLIPFGKEFLLERQVFCDGLHNQIGRGKGIVRAIFGGISLI